MALPDLPPVEHAGERVLTTELLACAYGVDEKSIHDNHQANRDRFVEAVHYHRLTGDTLKAFKNYPGNSGLVGKRAPHLILWTERGAARHAKMLHTDAAWAVFGKLEETYFLTQVVPTSTVSTSAAPHTGRALVADFRAFASLGPLLGYDRNQATLAANRAVRHLRGVDLLSAMGANHLIAPQQERLLTPTDIGKELGGKSGMAVNALLAELGLQVGHRDAKNRAWWEPTETGMPYAVWLDTGKQHSDGTPVRQLKWVASIIDHLTVAA